MESCPTCRAPWSSALSPSLGRSLVKTTILFLRDTTDPISNRKVSGSFFTLKILLKLSNEEEQTYLKQNCSIEKHNMFLNRIICTCVLSELCQIYLPTYSDIADTHKIMIFGRFFCLAIAAVSLKEIFLHVQPYQ